MKVHAVFLNCSYASQIAYEETGKSDGIQKNLRFLVSVNQRLELNSNLRLHDVAEHLENLECAALDVSSTMMNYLSCAVRYFSKRLISEHLISCR